MTLDEIYDLCLTAHAFKRVELGMTMNPIVYLEMHGGPIIARCIQHYGVQQVVEDFITKIKSEN